MEDMEEYMHGFSAAAVWAMTHGCTAVLNALLATRPILAHPVTLDRLFELAIAFTHTTMLQRLVDAYGGELTAANVRNLCALACLERRLDVLPILFSVPCFSTACSFECHFRGGIKWDGNLMALLQTHPRVDLSHAAWYTELCAACANAHVDVVQQWLQVPGIDAWVDEQILAATITRRALPLIRQVLRFPHINPWLDLDWTQRLLDCACEHDDVELARALGGDHRAASLRAGLDAEALVKLQVWWWGPVVRHDAVAVAAMLLKGEMAPPQSVWTRYAIKAPLASLLLDWFVQQGLHEGLEAGDIVAIAKTAPELLCRLLTLPQIDTPLLHYLMCKVVRHVPTARALIAHPQWKRLTHSALANMCIQSSADADLLEWLVFCIDTPELSPTLPRAHALLMAVNDKYVGSFMERGPQFLFGEDDVEGRGQLLASWLFDLVGVSRTHPNYRIRTQGIITLLLATQSFPLLPSSVAKRMLCRAMSHNEPEDSVVSRILRHPCIGDCLPHESWEMARNCNDMAPCDLRFRLRMHALHAHATCWASPTGFAWY